MCIIGFVFWFKKKRKKTTNNDEQETYLLFKAHTMYVYMSYVGKWVANGYMCCNI